LIVKYIEKYGTSIKENDNTSYNLYNFSENVMLNKISNDILYDEYKNKSYTIVIGLCNSLYQYF
jgi:hypothetical protein